MVRDLEHVETESMFESCSDRMLEKLLDFDVVEKFREVTFDRAARFAPSPPSCLFASCLYTLSPAVSAFRFVMLDLIKDFTFLRRTCLSIDLRRWHVRCLLETVLACIEYVLGA